MKAYVWAAAIAVLVGNTTFAEEPRRELGPHQHGHGSLNIAVDGQTISMSLDAPGADIAGFEHAPKTPEQIAAIERAKATLSAGLAIFTPAAAAGCKLVQAKVEIEGAETGNPQESEKAGDETGGGHSDFNVEYTLTCTDISKLTDMTLGYFSAFPGARELDISLLSAAGQSTYKVTREQPVLSFKGVFAKS